MMRNGEREAQWTKDMRAAIEGSRAAYEHLLKDLVVVLRRDISSNARRFGFEPADVEDIVQETILAIHLKRHTWDPARPLGPWVRAIAQFKLLDAGRRRSRRGVEIDVTTLADALPATDERIEERLAPIERGLAMLPPRQREIVEALAVQGASVSETASRMKMTNVAVRVALHRGLANLAAKFSRRAPA